MSYLNILFALVNKEYILSYFPERSVCAYSPELPIKAML